MTGFFVESMTQLSKTSDVKSKFLKRILVKTSDALDTPVLSHLL